MSDFTVLKTALHDLSLGLSGLLSRAEAIFQDPDPGFDHWRNICRTVERQMEAGIVRVAVVGAIKSGKSTLVNSIFQADYLRRGAGVVTSIVTRIRKGPYLKATLFFKSWDEVNADIEQAMALLPQAERREGHKAFDIRREKDRMHLEQALASLPSDALVADGARNLSSVLMTSYLDGYDSVRDILAADRVTKVYEEDQFEGHKAFSGNDTLAVYLKDLQLEIKGDHLAENVEIADCQGSDSPNPMHLAMIQDYLLQAHLLIYVISSRTGLRQADFRFLSIIKEMGLLGQTVFVINCDISEHGSVTDLRDLVQRTISDIGLMIKDPAVFSVSALYLLFSAQLSKMPSRDRQRLAQWENERDIIQFLDRETQAFNGMLKAKLTRERSRLLLLSNVERMRMVSAGLVHWARLHRTAYTRDATEFKKVLEKIDFHQQQMNAIESLLKQTLSGVKQKLKTDAKSMVDGFFEARSGGIRRLAVDFIRGYQANLNNEARIRSSSFAENLFYAFQDFKNTLDLHISEHINPKIVRLVGEAERHIAASLKEVAKPYDGMLHEAVSEYRSAVGQMGLGDVDVTTRVDMPADASWETRQDEMKPPSLGVTLQYAGSIKAEAVLRLGAYRILQALRKIFRRSDGEDLENRRQALQDGIRRIQREAEKSINQHVTDYRENIKFQYIYKRIDTMAEQLYLHLRSRFQYHDLSLAHVSRAIKSGRTDKAERFRALKEIERESMQYLDKSNGLRKEARALHESV